MRKIIFIIVCIALSLSLFGIVYAKINIINTYTIIDSEQAKFTLILNDEFNQSKTDYFGVFLVSSNILDNEVENVECNHKILDPFSSNEALMKSKNGGYFKEVISEGYDSITFFHVFHVFSEPFTKINCKIDVDIKGAYSAYINEVSEDSYKFSTTVFSTPDMESLTFFVKVPEGYNITRVQPEKGIERDYLNEITWVFENNEPLPSIRIIEVDYKKSAPSTTKRSFLGWFWWLISRLSIVGGFLYFTTKVWNIMKEKRV